MLIRLIFPVLVSCMHLCILWSSCCTCPGLFRENEVDPMTTHTLALEVNRWYVAMILTTLKVVVISESESQQPATFQCWGMTQNAIIHHLFPTQDQRVTVITVLLHLSAETVKHILLCSVCYNLDVKIARWNPSWIFPIQWWHKPAFNHFGSHADERPSIGQLYMMSGGR